MILAKLVFWKRHAEPKVLTTQQQELKDLLVTLRKGNFLLYEFARDLLSCMTGVYGEECIQCITVSDLFVQIFKRTIDLMARGDKEKLVHDAINSSERLQHCFMLHERYAAFIDERSRQVEDLALN